MSDDKRPENPWKKGSSAGPEKTQGDQEIDAVLRRLRELKGQIGGSMGGGPDDLPVSPRVVLYAVAGIFAFWIFSGFFSVAPGEQAVVQRFGAYQRLEAEAGLRYALPWPIEKVTLVGASLDRRMQIGFNEAGQNIPEESLMLTSDANIVDVKVSVLWNITEANKFIFNIRDPENTIRQVAQSAIREVVGQTPLQSMINEGRDDVARRIRDRMRETLKSYEAGVNISQVLILQNTVHPDVLEAFKDVVAAKQDAERFQNEAMIYRNEILPKAAGEAAKMQQEAEGYKQTIVSKAQGDAARFDSILTAYQQGKEVTRDRIYIETMQDILSGADKIIMEQTGATYMPLPPLEGRKKESAQ